MYILIYILVSTRQYAIVYTQKEKKITHVSIKKYQYNLNPWSSVGFIRTPGSIGTQPRMRWTVGECILTGRCEIFVFYECQQVRITGIGWERNKTLLFSDTLPVERWEDVFLKKTWSIINNYMQYPQIFFSSRVHFNQTKHKTNFRCIFSAHAW